jgi:hypothetical protein
VRQRGFSAYPPTTARSTAELGTRGVSLSLCGPALRVGGHPPTEIVRARLALAPPTLPILRSKGGSHRLAAGGLSAVRVGDLRANRGVGSRRVSRVHRAATPGQPVSKNFTPAGRSHRSQGRPGEGGKAATKKPSVRPATDVNSARTTTPARGRGQWRLAGTGRGVDLVDLVRTSL